MVSVCEALFANVQFGRDVQAVVEEMIVVVLTEVARSGSRRQVAFWRKFTALKLAFFLELKLARLILNGNQTYTDVLAYAPVVYPCVCSSAGGNNPFGDRP